jgi:hypothetical protein
MTALFTWQDSFLTQLPFGAVQLARWMHNIGGWWR